MRELEVRRHTMRTQPGQHLSQAGVDLARRVGESMGRFDRVVTSTLPRAFETALAMGFAVDEQLEALSSIDAGVDAEVDWELGCAAFQRALRLGGATARYSRRQAAVWRRIVEAGTVGCLPDSDYTAWGPACGYCEGVRLHYDAGRWSDAQLLRL